jgi:hypothetical protein
MSRQARIEAPGAMHPILIQGIEQRGVFEDDKDRGKRARSLSRDRISRKLTNSICCGCKNT